MRTSKQGIETIKAHEGLRLEAYDDGVGVWTVGYGSTLGVKKGMAITRAEADARLISDLAEAERTVDFSVTVPLSQQQFDALVSLAFNIGAGAFTSSTLVKRLNESKYHDAAAQFDRWVHAGKKKLPGLVKRRAAEKTLFLDGTKRPEMKPLVKSRTVVGGSISGAAVVASEVVTEVKEQIEPIVPYAESLRLLFLLVALAGIGLTIWARVNDRKRGLV